MAVRTYRAAVLGNDVLPIHLLNTATAMRDMLIINASVNVMASLLARTGNSAAPINKAYSPLIFK